MLSLTYFEFLCNLTVLLIIVFTALSYATGLFYLAELAEEFPTTTKRVILGLISAIVVLHLAAFLSPLSKLSLLLGLLTHASYYRLMSTFPFLPLSSPTFFLSLFLLFASQVSWYLTLSPSAPASAPYHGYTPYSQQGAGYARPGQQYTGPQTMAFFLLFVWLIPLVFFVAGSVSSQALPMMGDRLKEAEDDGGDSKGKKGARLSLSGLKRWWRREKEPSDTARTLEDVGGGSGVNGGGGGLSSDDFYPQHQQHPHARHSAQPSYGGDSMAAGGSAPGQWYGSSGSGSPAAPSSGYVTPGTPAVPSASSEGEWMGQQQPARPVYMRQRSHIN